MTRSRASAKAAVTVYTTAPNCMGCVQTKRHLDRRGIVYSATDAGTGRRGTGIGDVLPGQPDATRRDAADSSRNGWHQGRTESARLIGGSDAARRCDGAVDLLPKPSAADGGGGHLNRSGERGGELLLPGIARAHATGDLLPTPTCQDATNNGGPSQFERNTLPLNAVAALLPTPAAADWQRGQDADRNSEANRDGSGGDDLVTAAVKAHNESQWGKYAPAITRWEAVLSRPAPPPTEPNRNGKPRLNPEFSSWMMGWPAGWVTDPAIGISRNDQLRCVGNGVVTVQAVAALRYLLAIEAAA